MDCLVRVYSEGTGNKDETDVRPVVSHEILVSKW